MTETVERRCPECESPLGANARYCGCGWGRTPAGKPADPVALCARVGCPDPAVEKIKTPGGWTNYCHADAMAYRQAEADEACQRMGLTTPAQKRKFVVESMRAISRRWVAQREPGQDDEERAAV